jgi:hypothetical protein
MAKAGLTKITYKLCNIYLIIVGASFIIMDVFAWILYFHEENYGRLCVIVRPEESHHFMIDENEACLIDWVYLVNEPLFISILLFCVVLLPVIILRFFLKKKLESKGIGTGKTKLLKSIAITVPVIVLLFMAMILAQEFYIWASHDFSPDYSDIQTCIETGGRWLEIESKCQYKHSEG